MFSNTRVTTHHQNTTVMSAKLTASSGLTSIRVIDDYCLTVRTPYVRIFHKGNTHLKSAKNWE